MATRTILVSDLHLTTNPQLDDFTRDDDFEALLALPELRPEGGDVALVLLGDTFDLWQSVPDAECEASEASDIPLEYRPRSEAERLAELRERHGRWFDALGRYLRQDGARVLLVPGNHDHALVAPELQAALASLLGVSTERGQLAFPSYYEDARLALYADHGSQYDSNNDVADFSSADWKQEAAGYYFVKLFFNRLEHRDPRVENSPAGWGGAWHWLRRLGNLPLVAAAIRWFWQYWTDPRVPQRIGPARALGVGRRRVASPSAPLLLVEGGPPRAARATSAFFSEDPEMEAFLREAYRRSPEVRVAVNEILDARAAGARPRQARPRGPAGRAGRRAALARPRPEVPTPEPSRPVPAPRTRGLGGPPSDVAWAEGLFTGKPWFRERLDREDFSFVVLGHTHGELVWPLANGATYLNTGTWALDRGPLPVVVAEATPAGPGARLAHLSDGVLAGAPPAPARAAPRRGCAGRTFDARSAIAALSRDVERLTDALGSMAGAPERAPAMGTRGLTAAARRDEPPTPEEQALLDLAPPASRPRLLRFLRSERVIREPADRTLRGMKRIVGGEPIPSSEFPSCCCLGASEADWFCSGVLVHPRLVLTAAHCADADIARVLLGASRVPPASDGAVVAAGRVFVHPEYVATGRIRNDLAIVALREDAAVAPASLATREELAAAESVDLVGFGYDDPERPVGFGRKRFVNVTIGILEPDGGAGAELEERFGFDSRLEFVAGRKGLGRDTCNGDSGGPAYVEVGGEVRVAGITSRATDEHLVNCGDGGIYTRPDRYLDWIRSVAGEVGVTFAS